MTTNTKPKKTWDRRGGRRKQPKIEITGPLPPAATASPELLSFWHAEIFSLIGDKQITGAAKIIVRIGYAKGRVGENSRIIALLSEALDLAGACDPDLVACIDVKWSAQGAPGEMAITVAATQSAHFRRTAAGRASVRKHVTAKWVKIAADQTAIANMMEAPSHG